MGCHTWYRIPLVKGKENIQQYVREKIDADRKQEWWNDKCEEEAVLTIKAITDLDENMDENSAILLGAYYNIEFINKEPIIYINAYAYDIDEPRVGGYPDTIIKSADEMFKAMENGVIDSKGNICNFYWDKDRDSYIRNNIIGFFNSHPDGIIEFGYYLK